MSSWFSHRRWYSIFLIVAHRCGGIVVTEVVFHADQFLGGVVGSEDEGPSRVIRGDPFCYYVRPHLPARRHVGILIVYFNTLS